MAEATVRRAKNAGKTKVSEFEYSIRSNQKVVWLEILVHHGKEPDIGKFCERSIMAECSYSV